jgi:hypothetical protein
LDKTIIAAGVWTSDLLKIAIPCFTLLTTLIIFTIGSKFKWFAHLSISKNGLDVKAMEIIKEVQEKQEEKQFESGNVNKLLDDQIIKCDTEIVDFALEQSNKLRKTINIRLNKQVRCSGTRRSLASCLRYPLWEAARKNHFKEILRPEHAKEYVNRLLKEIIEEYQMFAIEIEMAHCVVNSEIKCQELPSLDTLLEMLREEIITKWALPIRQFVICTCKKKIQLYKEFLPSFKDLGDNLRIKRSELCIEKNQNYINMLQRKPEPGEV